MIAQYELKDGDLRFGGRVRGMAEYAGITLSKASDVQPTLTCLKFVGRR